MLSIFRTNQVFANILLIIYAIILHISAFIVPTTWQAKSGGILSAWLYSLVEVPSILAQIFMILLIAFQGAFINFMINKFRISNEVNLFPGVFYILISSILSNYLHLSPVILGNTFLILALYQLMETYKKYSCAGNIYNLGLWIGVASLFYFSFCLFLLVGWIGLNALRAFKIKERIILLLGFISPYILAFTVYFYQGKGYYFFKRQISDNTAFLDFQIPLELNSYIGLGAFALLCLVALFSMRSYYLKKKIQVQKNINILYQTLLVFLFTFLLQANISIEHLLIASIPLGIFLSFNFTDMSKQYAEAIHFTLLTLILVWHFLPLFQFS